MGVFWSNCRIKVMLTEEKMGATRFFIFSTFLVLMFGFALSLPTVGNEDPQQGLLTRFRRSQRRLELASYEIRDSRPNCHYTRKCSTVNGKRKCRRVKECSWN